MRHSSYIASALVFLSLSNSAQSGALTMQQVINKTARPYTGKTCKGVDRSTLTGKVMCGYQGWFACKGDKAYRDWFHWSDGSPSNEENCKFDLVPDISELDKDELYSMDIKYPDGRPLQVFSSTNRKTVLRHFKWMRDYGIDGVFVQRFGCEIGSPISLRHCNMVLSNCREGANIYGRAYAVAYDLSGLRRGGTKAVIADWKMLVDRMQIKKDPAYLHHKGKLVVEIWGVGFNDHRPYTLEECARLVKFFKSDKKYGNCCVVLGVPTFWRIQDRDAIADRALLELMETADVISPWTIGRYTTLLKIGNYYKETVIPDLAWCKERNLEYMPVVFPGFSWAHLDHGSKLNFIPRDGGKFLWKQYAEAKKAGATMVYQAMFDEVDEGTAIFKCTNDVPPGFLTYMGLPSDHYLWLVGQATQMLRGRLPISDNIPVRRRK